MLTGVVYSARNFTILFIVCCVALIFGTSMAGIPTRADNTHFSGWFLIYYFFVGVLFATYAKHIPVKLWLFIVCGIVYVAGMLLQLSDFITGIALVYCTVYIGSLNMEWFNKRMKADYSYGFYLYGYPITQTLIAVLLPLGIKTMPQPLALVILLVATFTLTGLFATVSWTFIEKPFLGLKKHFIKKP